MADKKKGYVPIYRSLRDNHLWQSDEPFDMRSAWIDILLRVNHKEEKILVGHRWQVIKPGQTWTSYVKLAQAWHWSYKRVLRYISLLKSDGMILADGTANGTLLTVVNWGFYTIQGKANDTASDIADDIPSDTAGATTGATQTIMINKINNVNNEKKEKAPFSKRGERQ